MNTFAVVIAIADVMPGGKVCVVKNVCFTFHTNHCPSECCKSHFGLAWSLCSWWWHLLDWFGVPNDISPRKSRSCFQKRPTVIDVCVTVFIYSIHFTFIAYLHVSFLLFTLLSIQTHRLCDALTHLHTQAGHCMDIWVIIIHRYANNCNLPQQIRHRNRRPPHQEHRAPFSDVWVYENHQYWASAARKHLEGLPLVHSHWTIYCGPLHDVRQTDSLLNFFFFLWEKHFWLVLVFFTYSHMTLYIYTWQITSHNKIHKTKSFI